MDYKIGDKVFYKDGNRLLTLVINKISKDKTMFLFGKDKDRYFSSILSTEKMLVEYFEKQFNELSPDRSFYGLSVLNTEDWGSVKCLYGYGEEDKYDDVYHLTLTNDHIKYEGHVANAKSKEDVPDVYEFGHYANGKTVVMVRTPELAAKWLLDKVSDVTIEKKKSEEQNLLDKYNSWLEKNDYFARDKTPTDWNGETKQLVYAIENDISPVDYDIWQAVEKHFGSEMSFESAHEIFDILDTEGIAI